MSSSEADADEGGDSSDGDGGCPGGDAPTLYPYGSWICCDCDAVNSPDADDCPQPTDDGRACPSGRGSAKGHPPYA